MAYNQADHWEYFYLARPMREHNRNYGLKKVPAIRMKPGSKKDEIYVGSLRKSLNREIFYSSIRPTRITHGYKYKFIIGPFKYRRPAGTSLLAAKLMVHYGYANSEIQTVSDAEKLAEKGKKWLKEHGFQAIL